MSGRAGRLEIESRAARCRVAGNGVLGQLGVNHAAAATCTPVRYRPPLRRHGAGLPLACTPTETRGPAPGPTAAVEKPLDGSTFVVRHLAGKVDLVCPEATVRTALLEIARQRPDLHLAVDPDLAEG